MQKWNDKRFSGYHGLKNVILQSDNKDMLNEIIKVWNPFPPPQYNGIF